jgi:hypothetical protein
MYLIQSGLILLTIPFPFVFNVTLPLITVSILMLPITGIAYAQILGMVGFDAAMTIVDEVRDNTLTLLRATPLTVEQILLGKMSASLWRRVDDLTLILLSITVFSMPPVVLEYANMWSPEKYPVVAHLAMIIVLGASIVRIAVEPFMVAALGVMFGAALPTRSASITVTLVMTGFYFLLINLPRLLPLSLPLRVFVEGVLPLVLPVLITLFALRLTAYLITRD